MLFILAEIHRNALSKLYFVFQIYSCSGINILLYRKSAKNITHNFLFKFNAVIAVFSLIPVANRLLAVYNCILFHKFYLSLTRLKLKLWAIHSSLYTKSCSEDLIVLYLRSIFSGVNRDKVHSEFNRSTRSWDVDTLT